MTALVMSSENPAAPQGTGTGSASKGTRNQGRTVCSRADGGTTDWESIIDNLDPVTRQLGGERRDSTTRWQHDRDIMPPNG